MLSEEGWVGCDRGGWQGICWQTCTWLYAASGCPLPTWHILQEDVEAVAGGVKVVADVAHNVGVAQVLVALQLLDRGHKHSTAQHTSTLCDGQKLLQDCRTPVI
jgi:hypothetical protein